MNDLSCELQELFYHLLLMVKAFSASRQRPLRHRADARKIKSAGRRGNIGPSAGLVILELTEPADRPAVARPMQRFFEHTQPADFII